VPINVSHLVERFGLFTLIVLGESVVAVVVGLEGQSLSLGAVVAAALGLAIAFGLWWIYFDNLDSAVFQRPWIVAQTWFYTHLPLVMGLTAAGAGVRLVISHSASTALPDAERWLICGAIALSLLAIGVIQATTFGTLTGRARFPYRCGAAVAALLLAAAGHGLVPLAVIALLAALCAAQVIVDLLATARAAREDDAEAAPA
jgi:low temperature requirement protein LtrA